MPRSSKSDLVPRASLSDTVYKRLRDEILRGDIPDGTSLSQVYLAERFGVSRIPIREALRRLQAESFVHADPYHPYVVRNVTPAQVLELVDIRAALEDLAITRREPPAPAEIAQLRRINQQMEKTGRGPSWFTLDRSFHDAIAGPSTVTAEMINDVRDRMQKYVRAMVSGQPGRKTATAEHARIIDALEAGDMARARECMRQHVNQSRAFIVDRLADSGITPVSPAAAT
jgi:DNA-binding GntR family transcriptional regulator